jgi:hypothetical protein
MNLNEKLTKLESINELENETSIEIFSLSLLFRHFTKKHFIHSAITLPLLVPFLFIQDSIFKDYTIFHFFSFIVFGVICCCFIAPFVEYFNYKKTENNLMNTKNKKVKFHHPDNAENLCLVFIMLFTMLPFAIEFFFFHSFVYFSFAKSLLPFFILPFVLIHIHYFFYKEGFAAKKNMFIFNHEQKMKQIKREKELLISSIKESPDFNTIFENKSDAAKYILDEIKKEIKEEDYYSTYVKQKYQKNAVVLENE